MKNKKWMAEAVLWSLAIIVIPLWYLSYPETSFQHNIKPFYIYGSQLTALTGYVLFALSFILATRMKWLEDLFGGLDQVYHLHHKVGKTAFFLLLAHPVLLFLRRLTQDSGDAWLYFLPFHRRLAVNLGSWALLGLIVLILFTLIVKIPYDKWKITHKFMGLIFLLGMLHLFLKAELLPSNPLLILYLGLISLAALLSFLYKTLFFIGIKKVIPYRVEKVHRLNDQVLDITLFPERDQIRFTPGQFCFFSFRGKGMSREAHPFTLCSAEEEKRLSIMVKSLGDYTQNLYKTLQAGDLAYLEGPYGRFDYKKGGPEQIWIAGGVGIAPFISWVKDIRKNGAPQGFKTSLYYCVNHEEEAFFVDFFRAFEKDRPGFDFRLIRADIEGFLNPAIISGLQNREIYLCGPKAMRKTLLREFRVLNIPIRRIHYEDFDFF